jgi:type IV fimbrial biogenesis protein FimT
MNPPSRRALTDFSSGPSRGFTLLELMVTLLVAGVLIVVAVPGFAATLRQNRLLADANQFLTALNLARSEAIKRGALVSVHALAGNGSNEWGGGWEIRAQEGSGARTLRRFPALDPRGSLDSLQGMTRFDFQGSGRTGVSDTLLLCDDRTGETGRQFSMVTTGRVRMTPVTCT